MRASASCTNAMLVDNMRRARMDNYLDEVRRGHAGKWEMEGQNILAWKREQSIRIS
jgi:hypothetical protein